jgi:ABC-type nitrate/sulfonate/bicarbonate transport systems, periplasmic components
MRIGLPDLVSNSYFPAIAAVELGYMREEGLSIDLELLFPVTDAAHALREGKLDFLAGAAHAPLVAFPDWKGVKLLGALSHNMYWFLVVHADLDVAYGDLSALHDMYIGAAPGVDIGLRELFVQHGVDIAEAKIQIAPVPGTDSPSVSFGVTAAEALKSGRIDAFWANGMGAEVAVRSGAGKVIVDARRDGPPGSTFTFSALMTTDAMIEREPEKVAAAVRALVRAQKTLREDPERATAIGQRLFPAMEATLIARIIERDLPFYDASISEAAVDGMNDFARRRGLLNSSSVRYDEVVATQFAHLWTA